METRDIRLSVDQLKMINFVLMIQPPELFKNHPELDELLSMLLDTVNNSDPETLNDFTA